MIVIVVGFPPGNNCNNCNNITWTLFTSVQVLHCLPSSMDIFIHTNIFVIMANGGGWSFRPFSSTLSFVRRVNLANQEQSHNRLENYFQLATSEYNEIVFSLCFYCPMKYFRIHCNQRWANSVLMTEYEYEYYSTFQKWPNTNTNIIRFEKGDQIRISFRFKKQPNTNTNIIQFEKIDQIRIRILFGLKKSPEYEYKY